MKQPKVIPEWKAIVSGHGKLTVDPGLILRWQPTNIARHEGTQKRAGHLLVPLFGIGCVWNCGSGRPFHKQTPSQNEEEYPKVREHTEVGPANDWR